mgnify:CR=1 FL=1
MRKFEKGQKVFWNDPAGETSGEYKVYDAFEEKYADLTDEDLEVLGGIRRPHHPDR